MSGGGGSQTVHQNADPWRGQQQYLLDLFQRAQTAADNPPEYFPGQTVASQTPETTQAQQMLTQQATGGSQQVADASTNAAVFNLGAGRDVASNPYLQAAITGAIRPTYQQLTDVALPAIGSNAEAHGQYGSSRQGVAEGLAISRANQSAGDIAARMSSEGYMTGLDNATKTLALAPTVQQAGSMPASQLDAVGQQKQAYNQALIDAEMNRWNYAQNEPWMTAQNYQQILQGSFGGSATTTSPSAQVNPAMSAVGGAAMGYALAPMLGVAGPVGAGIGAIAMLLMSQS